jgi:hypothetical protein
MAPESLIRALLPFTRRLSWGVKYRFNIDSGNRACLALATFTIIKLDENSEPGPTTVLEMLLPTTNNNRTHNNNSQSSIWNSREHYS